MGSTGINAALGFLYWWLAARAFPAETIGIAAAVVSAMTLLGSLSALGLGTLLIGQLGRPSAQRAELIVTALLVVFLAGLALGSAAALGVGQLAPALQPFAHDAKAVLLFAVGVGLTAFASVADQALIGLLWGNAQLGRNVLFAGGKLVLLAALASLTADRGPLAVYVTWIAGTLLSLAALVPTVALRRKRWLPPLPRLRALRGLRGQALLHHTLNLALQTPGFILPVLVTAMLTATQGAHFYIAWMIASMVFVAPAALATVLYAVTATDQQRLARTLRFTVGLSLQVGVAANVALVVVGAPLLGLFGSAYSADSLHILRLLGLAVFAIIVKDHYVAIFRVRGAIGRVIAPVALGCALEIMLPGIGAAVGGIEGLTIGWLVGLFAQALYMAPTVWRALRY